MFVHTWRNPGVNIYIRIWSRGKFTLDAHLALVIWAQSPSSGSVAYVCIIGYSKYSQTRRRSKRKNCIRLDVDAGLYPTDGRKPQIWVMTTPAKFSSDIKYTVYWLKYFDHLITPINYWYRCCRVECLLKKILCMPTNLSKYNMRFFWLFCCYCWAKSMTFFVLVYFVLRWCYIEVVDHGQLFCCVLDRPS